MDFNSLLHTAEVTAKTDEKKAMIMLESLIDKLEETGDRFAAYHSFTESFEYMIYDYVNQSETPSRNIAENFARMYQLYGNLLRNSGLYPEAAEALQKARRWNPVNGEIGLDCSEAWIAAGEEEKGEALCKEILRMAFKAPDFARGYRLLGSGFLRRKQYREAAGCFLLSLDYEPDSPESQTGLDAVKRSAGSDYKEPTVEEMLKISGENGFIIGANPDIVNLALAYARQAEENGSVPAAKYLLGILYDLMQDEHVKTMMDSLEEKPGDIAGEGDGNV